MIAPNQESTLETIAQAIAVMSTSQPNIAIAIGPDERISFQEADKRSSALAKALLISGVGKGSRVGLLYPNGIEFVVTFLAITRIGAVACPFNTFLKPPELAYQIRHSDIQLLLATPEFIGNNYAQIIEDAFPNLTSSGSLALSDAPYLREIVLACESVPNWATSHTEFIARGLAIADELVHATEENTSPADWLCILYTSGSTAAPKAVVHSHGGFVRRQVALAKMFGYAQADVIYSPAPWFWLGGLSQLLSALVAGASSLYEERFSATQTLEMLEREKATHVTAWPHYAASLRAEPSFAERDLRQLRGGSLYDQLMDPDRDPTHYAGGIGMTETAGHHSEGVEEKLPEALYGATGKLFTDIEHRIVDPETGIELAEGETGELQVRGYSVLQTYYKREREAVFTADGYFPTGDLGFIKEGFYFYTGRLGDMIKTSGANVSPAEVQIEIQNIDGVQACYVTGITDPAKDELVAVAIVQDSPATLTAEEIVAALKPRLSAFKIPKVIKFVPEFPMLATGKLDKRSLDQLLAE